ALAQARAGSVEVRAGALLRLARVLRKWGKKRESVGVYEELASLPQATVAGAPADLVARLELCAIRGPGETSERLKQDLLQGKWHLARGQFEFYWSEAARLSGENDPAPADQLALTDAAPAVWREMSREAAPRGERIRWSDGKPFLAFWRNDREQRVLFLTRAD